MQWQPHLQIPLGARDFISIQPSTDPHLDAFAAEAQSRIHSLAHGAAETNALFQLQCNRLRYQLRVEFRLMHFLDVDKHLSRRPLLQFALQLVNLRAFAADNDPRPRRLDNDAQLVARTLDLNRTHARRLQLVLQLALQINVFEQQFVVVPLPKPARLPRPVVTHPKTLRRTFSPHSSPSTLP